MILDQHSDYDTFYEYGLDISQTIIISLYKTTLVSCDTRACIHKNLKVGMVRFALKIIMSKITLSAGYLILDQHSYSEIQYFLNTGHEQEGHLTTMPSASINVGL